MAQVVPVRLDTEKSGKRLAAEYGVQSLPTVLFLDADGVVMHQLVGYYAPKDFASEMSTAARRHKDWASVKQILKQNPADGKANALYALTMARNSRLREAEKAIRLAQRAGYTENTLAKACNELGDLYFARRETAEHEHDGHNHAAGSATALDDAIAFFKLGEKYASEVDDRAYAKYSLMASYFHQKRMDTARRYAKEIVALKGVNERIIADAKSILKR